MANREGLLASLERLASIPTFCATNLKSKRIPGEEMAFVCQIVGPPTIEEVVKIDSLEGLVYLIGHDPDEKTTFFIGVFLNFKGSPEEPEYSFAIIKRYIKNNTQEIYFDSKYTREVFTSIERDMIVFSAVFLTMKLLDHFKPKRVFRCILDNPSHAGGKGLRKHHMISWAFTQVGYQVWETDSFNGDRYWYADRVDAVDE